MVECAHRNCRYPTLGWQGNDDFEHCWLHSNENERLRLLNSICGVIREPHLEGADFLDKELFGVTFQGGSLAGARFSRGALHDVIFNGTNLVNVVFSGALLEKVIFDKVDARRADFSKSRIQRCSFKEKSLFCQSDFRNANILDTSFERCEMKEVTFEEAELDRTRFLSVTAHDNCFTNARLVAFSDIGSVLRRSSFRTAVFAGGKAAVFRRSKLDFCDFSDAVFFDDYHGQEDPGTDFTPPRLVFDRCHLDKAVLRGAHLQNCKFVSSQARGCDLSGATFDRSELDEVMLSGGNLSGTTLKNSLVTKCTIVAATLDGAALENVCFVDSDISTSSFRNADLKGIKFKGTKLENLVADAALLKECEFLNVSSMESSRWDLALFDSCYFKEVGADNSEFKDVVFCDCYFIGNNSFRDCDFGGATFKSLSGVDLADCDFTRAKFAGSVMSACENISAPFASFESANLEKCEFSNLSHARVVDCRLVGAVFNDADLNQSDFSLSNLEGARFEGSTKMLGAICREANFTAAQMDNLDIGRSVFDGSVFIRASLLGACGKDASFNFCKMGADKCADAPKLSGLEANYASFRGADLQYADLRGADFTHATLDAANLQFANISRVKFQGASLIGVMGFHMVEVTDTSKGIDFSFAIIQYTRPILFSEKVKWNLFREFINNNKSSDNRRLSWVAWKNNYQSLGFYEEQGSCFVEEKRSEAGLHGYQLLNCSIPFFVLCIWLCAIIAAFSYLPHLLDGIASWVALLFSSAVVFTCVYNKVLRTIILDAVSGFGENPRKVGLISALSVALFTVAYSIVIGSKMGEIMFDERQLANTDISNLFYFSAVTFTTLGDASYSVNGSVAALAALESAIGLVLAALFIHSLARRTSGR